MVSRCLLSAALAVISALAVGCGPNCESTCNTLYQSEQCNVQSPGSDQTELLTTCMDSCEYALGRPGEVGDYKPTEYTPASVSVTLDNDKQAAVWMDCVSETACEFLESGYCAPVW
ncbi:MAG: hypothetical protein ACI8RZ_001057 [Myxococcota bacterium]